jgi:hypothetical protein
LTLLNGKEQFPFFQSLPINPRCRAHFEHGLCFHPVGQAAMIDKSCQIHRPLYGSVAVVPMNILYDAMIS